VRVVILFAVKKSFVIKMVMFVPLVAATSNFNPAIRPLQQNVYKCGGLKVTTHS